MIDSILMAAGLLLMLFGALGMLFLKDVFLRFHAATKCGVTGAVTMLLGLMARAGEMEYRARLFFIVLFVFLTAPLIPHTLGMSFLRGTRRPARGKRP